DVVGAPFDDVGRDMNLQVISASNRFPSTLGNGLSDLGTGGRTHTSPSVRIRSEESLGRDRAVIELKNIAISNGRWHKEIDRVAAFSESVNEPNLGSGPSPSGPSGRGRREAPGEGRRSSQTLRPSPYPLPEGEGDYSASGTSSALF